jgi:aromatic ring hydroxylase
MRTGVHYLESLRDGREIYVDGERVGDVTKHPAFAAAARTIAGLYDLAAEHRDFFRTWRRWWTPASRGMTWSTQERREDHAHAAGGGDA